MSDGEQLAGVQTAQLMVENLGTRWPGCKTQCERRVKNRSFVAIRTAISFLRSLVQLREAASGARMRTIIVFIVLRGKNG